MKGFNAKSVYDMDTDDGSLLWSITLENTSGNYLEFGDVGLPMPWNNKYASIDDTYNNRTTVHTFAGADSGYAYAIRCSGEGNYVMFTPVTDTGARIEYIDNWTGNINGVKGTRSEVLIRIGQVIPVDGSQDFRCITFIPKIFRKRDVVITQMLQVLY